MLSKSISLVFLFVLGFCCGNVIIASNASNEGYVVDKYYATNAFNGFYFVVVESDSHLFSDPVTASIKCEVDPNTYASVFVGDCVSFEYSSLPFGWVLGKGRLLLDI